jgi:hypothetical protein
LVLVEFQEGGDFVADCVAVVEGAGDKWAVSEFELPEGGEKGRAHRVISGEVNRQF